MTRGGRFLQEYVEGEKANLADAIRSIRNDKRDWADLRLFAGDVRRGALWHQPLR